MEDNNTMSLNTERKPGGLYRNVKMSVKTADRLILIGIIVCSLVAWVYALFSPEAAATAGIYLPEGAVRLESIAPIAGV